MSILSWLFRESKPRHKTSFQVKYLGCERIPTYGAHECSRTTATIYALKERQLRDIPLTTLQLSVEGLTELDQADENIATFDIQQIVFSAVDKQRPKLFAFFFQHCSFRRDGMDCHVFLCKSKRDAKELALGLGAAFEKAFLKKKKGDLLSRFRSTGYWEYQEAERKSLIKNHRARNFDSRGSLRNKFTTDSRKNSLEKVYENAEFLYELFSRAEMETAVKVKT